MKKLLLTLILALAAAAAPAQTLLERADSAYNTEDYRLAVRLYQQAIDTEGVSPDVYYNLGNAYYRINSLGRAVLCYSRALNLDPSMADARRNLDFVKTRIIDKPEDDSTFLENVHSSVVSLLSPDAWAWLALALFALLLGAAAMYVFSGRVAVRKTGFFGAGIVLLLFIYVSVIAWQSARAYSRSGMAVVTVPTTNMRTSPGSESTDRDKVLPIHEGTVVEITDSMTMPGEVTAPKWYHVKINNSTRAWVNAADVERI